MKGKVFLFFILALGFCSRLYKINIPLADHHSWRQADTAAVARNYIKEGWNFFFPKIDNFVPLHLGKPNDQRLFLVEPPIYNSLVAGVYKLIGVREKWARLVSIIFSLGSTVFLYFIAKNFFGEKTGLLSAFFFAILPYNIFYSRVVLPEPMIIFLTLGMFYYLIKWLDTDSSVYYLPFIVFSLLSFSQKSFPLFFLLPLAYLFWQKFGFNLIKQKKIFFWLIASFLPLILWRWWISRFPEGIPANLWLFNQGNIRFKGAFFWWLFAERIGKLILGYWGLPLLLLGVVLKPKKEGWFFHFWLLSLLIYLAVFAAGNVTHDYYQIPLIPIFCIFLAKGANFLLFEVNNNFNRFLCSLCFVLCTGFMVAFSWYQVRDFYNIQSGVDLAGRWIDENTDQKALIVTGDSNDATLLYNCNRWGWTAGYASSYPNEPHAIEELRSKGASFYVSTKFDKNSDFGKYMFKNYQLLKETDQFVAFSLINNYQLPITNR
ncbi:MAG TPA: glycosyltransferase family 39 protein [Candidatus Woesebacteria bacterium]|nr:glycosyltransferase family 39 protein [Candidatus Woesebacteria bacterium]